METKRASKKAIEQFEKGNNLSQENVFNLLESLFPDIYLNNDEIYKFIITSAYKQYDSITDEQLANVIKGLAEKKLDRFNKAYIRRMELEWQLNNIREKVIEKMKTGEDVLCSSFPEWTDEMREFIIKQYTWKRCYNDDGSYSLGRAFHEMFCNYDYNHDRVPFHCYTTDNGKDVLFTMKERKFGPTNSGCLSSILLAIFVSAITAGLMTIITKI